MANRIEIGFRAGIRDALGEKIKRRIIEHLRIPVDSVKTIEVYTIDAPLTPEELERAARGPLSDPVIQEYAVDRPLARGFDWLIEVGFRPGVTDNVGKTAAEAIALLIGKPLRVTTSRQYAIGAVRGGCTLDPLTRGDAERIASELLANDLIQRFDIIDGRTWDPAKGIKPYVPRVLGEENPRTEPIELDCPDEELVRISNERVLALTLDEMRILRDYLKNETVLARRKEVGLGAQMTDVELECLAQTWSEHCKHKIFNARIDYEDGEGHTSEIDSLFKILHQRSTTDDPGADGGQGLLPLRLQGQRRDHPLQRRLEPRLQGRDPQLPLGPRPLRRGAHRHRRRQPRPLRLRKGGEAHLQHRRLLFCPARSTTNPCRSGSSTRGGSTKGSGRGSSTAATRAASPR